MLLPAVLRQPTEPPALVACRPEVWLLTMQGMQGAGARAQAHEALRHLLSQCLGVAPQQVPLVFRPGRAPAVAGRWQGLGLSVSMSYALGMAAIGLCAGACLGIDLAVVAPLPDWEPVAQCYLGAQVARQLALASPAQRDQCFARAWAAMEARSKCLGMGLQEWSLARQQRLDTTALAWLPLAPGRLPEGTPPCVVALACTLHGPVERASIPPSASGAPALPRCSG